MCFYLTSVSKRLLGLRVFDWVICISLKQLLWPREHKAWMGLDQLGPSSGVTVEVNFIRSPWLKIWEWWQLPEEIYIPLPKKPHIHEGHILYIFIRYILIILLSKCSVLLVLVSHNAKSFKISKWWCIFTT